MEEILESLCMQIDHEFNVHWGFAFGDKCSASLIFKIRCQVQKLEPVMLWIQQNYSQHEFFHRVENVLQRFSLQFAELMTDTHETAGFETLLITWLGKLIGKDDLSLLVHGNTLRKINRKISDLESDIEILTQMLCLLKDSNSNVNGQSLPTCRYDLAQSLHFFVGRGDDLWTLETQIYKLNPIICIWGETGLGKSALAWRFYTCSRMKLCFDGRAWVTLTKDCPVEFVRLDVLRQIGQGLCQLENCLIVLDNVEGILQWEDIIHALSPHVGPRTKILLTTCNGKVAKHRLVGFTHKLEPLNADEGWELLKKHAFPNKDAPDFGMFYELGKEMVQKCQLVPLNISNVGRNLSCRTTLDGWHMVNKNLCHYLWSDHQIAEINHSFKELSSKYHNLSYNLRQCLLYSGCICIPMKKKTSRQCFLLTGWTCITTKAKIMSKEELMLLWMGECMVVSKDQKRQVPLIHNAENYLWKLVNEGMLQVELFHVSPRIEEGLNLCYIDEDVQEFSLHQRVTETFPLKVVDFCDYKLSKFYSLASLDVDFSGDNLPKLGYLSNLDVELRRLVIHFHECKDLTEMQLMGIENILEAVTQIQSLVFLNHGLYILDLPLKFDFAKLKMLRVVHFVRCIFDWEALPKGMDELMKLRYLGLSHVHHNSQQISISLSKLVNLNVLNLGALSIESSQIKIQNALSQMMQLKHLCLPHLYDDKGSDQSVKLKLDALTKLETLIGFNGHIHDVISLYKLQKLRHLEAYGYSNNSVVSILKFIDTSGTQLSANLWMKRSCSFTSSKELAILSAVLMCHNLCTLTVSGVSISQLPDCRECFSSTITQLNLISYLREDPMDALSKIPNLRKLIIGDMFCQLGFGIKVNKGGFQNLEHLELRHLIGLRTWEVNVGAMPRLSTLIIRGCQDLDYVPDGLASIYTLKTVIVELKRDKRSVGLEARYREIFSFVPSLVIKEMVNPWD